MVQMSDLVQCQKHNYCNTIEYNIFDITLFFVHVKLRSTRSRLGGAVGIVIPSIMGEELAQGPHTGRPERYSNLQPSGGKAQNLSTEPPRPTILDLQMQ